MEYHVYWLLKSSSFEIFGDEKYGLFLSQRVDRKMIFTWSFWGFYDIPGLRKYGFPCSVNKGYKVNILRPSYFCET